jgi:hypothetical protein
MSTERLDHAGHALIPFSDNSYRWIDVKRFSWSGSGTHDAALGGLVGTPQYGDPYLSPEHAGGEQVHGPYDLDAISPACFQLVSPSEAVSTIEEFCSLSPGPPASDVRQQVESLVLSPMRSAECYRLRELPHARHELGALLQEFREIVGLRRDAKEVLLVVMAID